jgi:hypothetical protein
LRSVSIRGRRIKEPSSPRAFFLCYSEGMQHFGLIPILTLIVGLVITVIKRPAGLDVTFSQRVANNKQAEILYSLLFVITLPLLFIFFASWFVPANDLPHVFLWFAAIVVIFQIVCTWVPERGGRMTIVHRLLTGISGIALLPMVLMLATARSISTELRYMALSGFVLMVILLTIALVNQKKFRYALLLQVGYYFIFFVVVLLVTYL